ncbi:MAG TPA: 2'-5' RNA ligase family protein, partial [Cryobacterium sp.]|nr:2'-5' RNA ligase family protein [Cryobacterium sp.]
MPRLVVVLPLTPLRTGDSFPVSAWPLHITVLPPFHTDAAASVIAGVIAGVAAATPSGRTTVTAVAGADALFGRREDVPVVLIDENPVLTELHRALVDAVRPFASSPDEPA